MTTEAIIQTVALAREYALGKTRVQALRGVDLTIQAGEFVALMGASGSGKSTLLHMLGLLDEPSSGQYFLEGRETSKLSSRERAVVRSSRLGFVFQNFFLLPDLSAFDNVTLPMLYQRSAQADAKDMRRRAAEALIQVGLGSRSAHRPMELSGGERQRVAIARALVANPAILMADEPTGNLDSATGQDVMKLLTGLWSQGLTILLVTHDPSVAAYARRVISMKDGQIVREELRDGETQHHQPEGAAHVSG